MDEYMSRGEVAITMAKADVDADFDSLGVPDTAHNRKLWAEIQADRAEAQKGGMIPEIPWDYTLD